MQRRTGLTVLRLKTLCVQRLFQCAWTTEGTPKTTFIIIVRLRHNPLNCIGISSSSRCSEKSTSRKPSLSLCIMNVRSIKNKSAEFVDYGTSCKVDLFALTETWLGKNDDAHRAEITPTGFKLIDLSRNYGRGGGTALYLEKIWMFKKLQRRNFVHLNIWSSLFHLAPLKCALSSFTAHPIRLHTLSPQALFSVTLWTIWKP